METVVDFDRATMPDGLRVYAIGDVHGCRTDFQAMRERIEADLAHRPIDDWRIVMLGDYIDRGPDSAGVLTDLAEASRSDERLVCLCGNHDRMMLDALGGHTRMRDIWLRNGGVETIESFGVAPYPTLWERDGDVALVDRLAAVLPDTLRLFVEGLETSVAFGDFRFVHAGINPDRRWDAQVPEDLMWIREPFLQSDRLFPSVVVHGHTPTAAVVVRPNRIGIDTGVVFGRHLTCLVLEGSDKALRTALGPITLTAN